MSQCHTSDGGARCKEIQTGTNIPLSGLFGMNYASHDRLVLGGGTTLLGGLGMPLVT